MLGAGVITKHARENWCAVHNMRVTAACKTLSHKQSIFFYWLNDLNRSIAHSALNATAMHWELSLVVTQMKSSVSGNVGTWEGTCATTQNCVNWGQKWYHAFMVVNIFSNPETSFRLLLFIQVSYQFLCGCPMMGGNAGNAMYEVRPLAYVCMNNSLYGVKSTTPTWSCKS